MCPLPNILPTPNTSRKHNTQPPNTTPSNPKPITSTSSILTNHPPVNVSLSKSPPPSSSSHQDGAPLESPSSTSSQKRGKVLGMISMFENLNPEKSVISLKSGTTMSEKIALSNAIQDEEKKKRFRARSNSFDLNSPSPSSSIQTTMSGSSNNNTNNTNNSAIVNNSSVVGVVTSTSGVVNNSNQKSTNVFHNISKNQLNTSNNTINNTVNSITKGDNEEEKSRLTRTPSMVQGIKARFEKLQFSLLEQIKKEEEWMQKKKERQLTARSHKDEHEISHRSDTSSCESDNNNNRNSIELHTHDQKHHDSMYDHEIISTDDEYSEDEQEMMTHDQHDTIIENKRRSQEERIHQHVFDTLMISPPPQIVAGMAAQSRQSLFYHELYGETASSSTPSPMDTSDSNTSAMNNDDWLESQMNRHQRYNISDLDLLTAYRHKSQLYQMQNPANVMMNPFIQESQVVLGGDADGEDYVEDEPYLSSDNDQTDINPEHRRSSIDMIGGVLDRQSEAEFTSWEKQMEEFGKALVI